MRGSTHWQIALEINHKAHRLNGLRILISTLLINLNVAGKFCRLANKIEMLKFSFYGNSHYDESCSHVASCNSDGRLKGRLKSGKN